jgi:hypothetical protein
MPYLFEIILFLLPFGLYALWRRLKPEAEPDSRTVLLALAGIGLGMAGAVWYGLSVSAGPEAVYVPARMQDGEVVPGHAEPKGPGHAEPKGPGHAEAGRPGHAETSR